MWASMGLGCWREAPFSVTFLNSMIGGEDWYGDTAECLVNTRNASDPSPPQEMEYHVTVSHTLGTGSKDLSAHCAGEEAPKLWTV